MAWKYEDELTMPIGIRLNRYSCLSGPQKEVASFVASSAQGICQKPAMRSSFVKKLDPEAGDINPANSSSTLGNS